MSDAHTSQRASSSARTSRVGRFPSLTRRSRKLGLAAFVSLTFLLILSWRIVATQALAYTPLSSLRFEWPPWPPWPEEPKRPPHAEYAIARCKQLRIPAGPPPDFNRNRRQSERYEPAWAKPTLIKNGILWTGRTSNGTTHIIHSGDILLDKGIIQSVKRDLGLPSTNPELRRRYPGTTDANTLRVVDAQGRWITPGIVDVHSHAGVDAVPNLSGSGDGNSMKGLTLPWLRSLDGLNTHDESYETSIAGGVTTSLILPGSADAIGGQAFVMKLRKTREKSSSSMLLEPPFTLNSSFPTGEQPVRWRHIKHACGENPSRSYDGTRMDTIWGFRKAYATAKQLKMKQDQYCERALADDWDNLGEFPEDLQWEALVDVLRGRVKVNTHCYEAVDFDAFIRLTNEFEFPVAAFHHASEAYLVPDLLKKAYGKTPAIALFAAFSRYKREAYRSSHFAPRVLAANGIPVIMKSDHPSAINSRFLLHEAQQAHHFGLSENIALASVISTAADALGMGHRIGYLKDGYDADLVIWDSHPLRLGATPTQVFIDGIQQLDSPVTVEKPAHAASAPVTPNYDEEAKQASYYDGLPPVHPTQSLPFQTTTMVFLNVTSLYQRKDGTVHEVFNTKTPVHTTPGDDGPECLDEGVACPPGTTSVDAPNALTVVMRKGKVICYGEERICAKHFNSDSGSGEDFGGSRASNVHYVDLKGGSIAPALVTFGSAMGLADIDMEESTVDGYFKGDPLLGDVPSMILGEENSNIPILRAVDALQFGTPDAFLAYRAGVTRAISPPGPSAYVSSNFVMGFSTAFSLGANHRLERGAVLQDQVAFHFHIGYSPDRKAPSVSTQIGALRRLLVGERKKRFRQHPPSRLEEENQSIPDSSEESQTTHVSEGAQPALVSSLLTGRTPLVIHTHNADIIASLIALKKSIASIPDLRDPLTGLHIHPDIKMTIVGGSEAHILAEELAEEGVGVILTPPRVFPTVWERRRTLPGPPLSQDSAVKRLISHGVVVGLGTHEPFGRWSARLLPWDLGWASLETNGTLTHSAALEMGSTNIERLLGLQVRDEDSDRVAVVGGDLLGMEGKPAVITSSSRGLIHLL